MNPPSLAERVVAGEVRAVARAISLVENADPSGVDLVRNIFGHTGRAYLIGITGPPGAGKSTLVDRIVTEFRHQRRSVLDTREHGARGPSEREGASEASGGGAPRALNDDASASGVGVGPHAIKVGVLAIDPTSPFTGGAVLGDRLRMQSHMGDDGVFIRSMATRGHLGGLSRATADAALVLDAAGREVVVIETVGVGQGEVEIVRTADITIVVLVPGAGDEVQALKAGIMEIADIFVVNKADREGADRLAGEIESNLSLQQFEPGEWRPPVLKTTAISGAGVEELVDTIWKFKAHSAPTQAARRRSRAEDQLREIVSGRFMNHLETVVLAPGELETIVGRIAAREIDPYAAAHDLLRRVGLP
ncbi:MAG: methylmalonyl Co-A mutase-associated GTPase MeaB [Vicinamibacterales bacterium]